jgi:hypothetical protein
LEKQSPLSRGRGHLAMYFEIKKGTKRKRKTSKEIGRKEERYGKN